MSAPRRSSGAEAILGYPGAALPIGFTSAQKIFGPVGNFGDTPAWGLLYPCPSASGESRALCAMHRLLLGFLWICCGNESLL